MQEETNSVSSACMQQQLDKKCYMVCIQLVKKFLFRVVQLIAHLISLLFYVSNLLSGHCK